MNDDKQRRCYTRSCGMCFACASANQGPIDDVGRKRLEKRWLSLVPPEETDDAG